MIEVKCNKCLYTITHDPMRLKGCNCDPDAPQWIAIARDTRFMHGSDAHFTVIHETNA